MAIFQDWVRGVPEFWIVIPELNAIEILIIEDNKYRTHSFAEIEGVVISKVIDGLEVNIKDVFE